MESSLEDGLTEIRLIFVPCQEALSPGASAAAGFREQAPE
jgi:hypothetical protein